MAFTFILNQQHNSLEAIFRLKEYLKDAGWAVLSSGDGSGGNWSSSEDILTGWHPPGSTAGSVVAGSVTNGQAWFRVRAPDGRELRYKSVSSNAPNDRFSFTYSRSAGHTGTGDGVLGATVAPTASDGLLIGTYIRDGNSVGVGFGALDGPSSINFTVSRVDYIIGGATEGYSFAVYVRDSSGVIRSGMLYDRLINPQQDDADPTVVWLMGKVSRPWWNAMAGRPGRSFLWGDATSSSGAPQNQSDRPQKYPGLDWTGRVDVGQTVNIGKPAYFTSTNGGRSPFDNWIGTGVDLLGDPGLNPYDGKIDVLQPVFWCSSTQTDSLSDSQVNSAVGAIPPRGNIWGQSRFIKGRSSPAGFGNMDTPPDLTLIGQNSNDTNSGNNQYGLWLLWDGQTTPIL